MDSRSEIQIAIDEKVSKASKKLKAIKAIEEKVSFTYSKRSKLQSIFPIQNEYEALEEVENTWNPVMAVDPVDPKSDYEDEVDSPTKVEMIVDIPSASKVSKAKKAAKKLRRKGRVPKSCSTTTMDHSKALGILGFNSARVLDRSSFTNPKLVLDKAHFNKTMAIMKKKEEEAVDSKKKVKEIQYSFKRKEMTYDDQIRIIHEAYQFLLKKYNLGRDLSNYDEAISPFMKLASDEPEEKVSSVDKNENKGL